MTCGLGIYVYEDTDMLSKRLYHESHPSLADDVNPRRVRKAWWCDSILTSATMLEIHKDLTATILTVLSGTCTIMIATVGSVTPYTIKLSYMSLCLDVFTRFQEARDSPNSNDDVGFSIKRCNRVLFPYKHYTRRTCTCRRRAES